MNFAKINDISIHFNYINNGVNKPTVVFSNSLGTDFRIWESCVENLSNDYSILTYDKRGHGLSGLESGLHLCLITEGRLAQLVRASC